MEPVHEFSVTASPDRCLLEIYDADAYLGDDQAWEESRRSVVAGNGYHLYLHSLQPRIPVRISIRIWEQKPPPPSADAEGHTAISLDSATGLLVISQLTLGPAGEMTLPQPGVYVGNAWWSGRQAASKYYDEVLEQLSDWTLQQISDAWSACPAEERYVLDLCYTRPSPEEEEDD
ncbi:hypothetical protein [Streptomyces sp. NPDC006368]|uniref:hypothetical protein n=1 Tax=Streptomyces sp. NPDC006368 TaxID=3156760 RepID=UPI0033B941ED